MGNSNDEFLNHSKCSNSYIFKPDGVHELDPCIYEDIEKYANVTVTIRRCLVCGHISVVWNRQEDTIQLDLEEDE